MPTMTVSEFSLILVTTGTPKNTRIKRIATRDDYAHYKDYYLRLRTAIKSLFTKKRHISYLFEICRKQNTTSKKIKYEIIANNFKDWQSGKNITAEVPPKAFYNFHQTTINCTPDLNVNYQGQARLVKLHFSGSDKMTQQRANIICALMEESIGNDDYLYSVLDLTTGNEFYLDSSYEMTITRIDNEIKSVESIWDEYTTA